MIVEKGYRIRLEYELRVKGGDVVEASKEGGPIEYIHGEGQMLPGLEKQLEGKRAGVEIKGEIPAKDALGPESAFPTTTIGRADFPKDTKLEVGATFEAKATTGNPVCLKVVEIGEKSVTVRLLPPIAGKDLEFRAKILMIEDPKTHAREVVSRKPPPPPAAALKVDLDESE